MEGLLLPTVARVTTMLEAGMTPWRISLTGIVTQRQAIEIYRLVFAPRYCGRCEIELEARETGPICGACIEELARAQTGWGAHEL